MSLSSCWAVEVDSGTDSSILLICTPVGRCTWLPSFCWSVTQHQCRNTKFLYVFRLYSLLIPMHFTFSGVRVLDIHGACYLGVVDMQRCAVTQLNGHRQWNASCMLYGDEKDLAGTSLRNRSTVAMLLDSNKSQP